MEWITNRNSRLFDIKKIDYGLYFSLLRSNVRREIVAYLYRYPQGAPIMDISQQIHVSYTNTKGAIAGGHGYNVDTSLLSVGVLRLVKTGPLMIYCLTPRGRKIAELMMEQDLPEESRESGALSA